jgi:hypothetical protein
MSDLAVSRSEYLERANAMSAHPLPSDPLPSHPIPPTTRLTVRHCAGYEGELVITETETETGSQSEPGATFKMRLYGLTVSVWQAIPPTCVDVAIVFSPPPPGNPPLC